MKLHREPSPPLVLQIKTKPTKLSVPLEETHNVGPLLCRYKWSYVITPPNGLIHGQLRLFQPYKWSYLGPYLYLVMGGFLLSSKNNFHFEQFHQAAHHSANVASHFAPRRLPCWAQLLKMQRNRATLNKCAIGSINSLYWGWSSHL